MKKLFLIILLLAGCSRTPISHYIDPNMGQRIFIIPTDTRIGNIKTEQAGFYMSKDMAKDILNKMGFGDSYFQKMRIDKTFRTKGVSSQALSGDGKLTPDKPKKAGKEVMKNDISK